MTAITRKFTKEQLIAKAQEQIEFIRRTRVTGAGREHVDTCGELFEIALASLEAEQVAWLWSHRKHPSEVTLIRPEDDERAEGARWSGWHCQPLTAQVISEDLPSISLQQEVNKCT